MTLTGVSRHGDDLTQYDNVVGWLVFNCHTHRGGDPRWQVRVASSPDILNSVVLN